MGRMGVLLHAALVYVKISLVVTFVNGANVWGADVWVEDILDMNDSQEEITVIAVCGALNKSIDILSLA